jgi:ABC-type glutathione transport system ATPase component
MALMLPKIPPVYLVFKIMEEDRLLELTQIVSSVSPPHAFHPSIPTPPHVANALDLPPPPCLPKQTPTDDDIIFVDNVHKTYLLGTEGVAALRGVSLRVRRGEFVMLFGTSGGGKTTLLNVVGTIDAPTKGSITLAGTRAQPPPLSP